MNLLKEKAILKEYDKLLMISFILLSVAVMVMKNLNIKISLAIYNLSITIIPFLYLLKIKIKINKKHIVPIFTMIIIIIGNLVINFQNLNKSYRIEEIAYGIVFIINIIVIYGIIYTDNNFKEKYKFTYIINAVIIIAISFCIYNFCINIPNLAYFNSSKNINIVCFSSFFNNRNTFALFLFLCIVGTFFLENKNKKIITLIQIFFIINLVFTLSRTGIISLVIFLLIYFLLTKKMKKYIIIILVTILLLVSLNQFNIIINDFLIRKGAGSSGRITIWKNCLQLIAKSPIIGYGNIYSSQLLETISTTSNSHNFYIKIVLEYGIIGFLSMSYLIFDIIKKDIYIYKNYNRKGAVCIATIISLLAYGITEEITLFSFGVSNMLITCFTIIIPLCYYNQIRSKK